MSESHGIVKHIDTAQQFHPDSPVRIEADNSTQVDVGLEMANRAKHPEQRPPEAQPAPVQQRSVPPLILNF